MPAPKSPQRRAYINELAQRISEEQTVRQAAIEMGVTLSAARSYFDAICKEVGDQSTGKWRIEWPK